MSGKAVAAVAALAVGAEATGATNFTGGSSGGVNVEVPTKAPDASIPRPPDSGPSAGMLEAIASSGPDTATLEALANSGPSIDEIAAVTQDSGPSDAMLALLASSGSQPAQVIQRGKEAAQGGTTIIDRARETVEDADPRDNSGNGNNSGSDDPVVKEAGAGPDTSGGKAGENVAQAAWHGAVKPLATALDQNTGLDGNAQDNIEQVKNGVSDAVGDGITGDSDSAVDKVKPDGSGKYKVFGDKANEGPLTPDKSPSEVVNDGFTGDSDTNAIDKGKDFLGL